MKYMFISLCLLTPVHFPQIGKPTEIAKTKKFERCIEWERGYYPDDNGRYLVKLTRESTLKELYDSVKSFSQRVDGQFYQNLLRQVNAELTYETLYIITQKLSSSVEILTRYRFSYPFNGCSNSSDPFNTCNNFVFNESSRRYSVYAPGVMQDTTFHILSYLTSADILEIGNKGYKRTAQAAAEFPILAYRTASKGALGKVYSLQALQATRQLHNALIDLESGLGPIFHYYREQRTLEDLGELSQIYRCMSTLSCICS